MENFIKCKVVRLETDTITKNCIVKIGGKLCSPYTGGTCDPNKVSGMRNNVFHIYILILENESLKNGDWVINNFASHNNCIELVGRDNNLNGLISELQKKGDIYKIIASTDSSLNLPRPSNEFLKKYCEEGGIDEVMVEYEDYCPLAVCSDLADYGCGNCPSRKQRVKVAPDNTITIRKVKDTWTRKEVEELIEKAYIASWSTAVQYHQNNGSYVSPTEWINKNL